VALRLVGSGGLGAGLRVVALGVLVAVRRQSGGGGQVVALGWLGDTSWTAVARLWRSGSIGPRVTGR
jgi:hypothetical protein